MDDSSTYSKKIAERLAKLGIESIDSPKRRRSRGELVFLGKSSETMPGETLLSALGTNLKAVVATNSVELLTILAFLPKAKYFI